MLARLRFIPRHKLPDRHEARALIGQRHKLTWMPLAFWDRSRINFLAAFPNRTHGAPEVDAVGAQQFALLHERRKPALCVPSKIRTAAIFVSKTAAVDGEQLALPALEKSGESMCRRLAGQL